MRDIVILGATGSIGSQVLDVLEDENYNLIGFSFGNNYDIAIEIIEKFKPKYVCSLIKEDSIKIKEKYDVTVFYGNEGIVQLCSTVSNCKVVNAIYGIAGLRPLIAAINNHLNCIVSNKESIVIAGELVMKLAKDNGVSVIPLDSEHTGILEGLQNSKNVKKLYITSSGGSFKDKTREQLIGVTLNEALKHPTWSMGKMITINSATMVNKCFEIIEAHHFFGYDYDDIITLLHPESIIHAVLEYDNGVYSMISSQNDMRVSTSYCLNYPECVETKYSNLELDNLIIHLNKMDVKRYPLINLAYKVGKTGKDLPAVFSASNDAAVELFIEEKIDFLDIERIITETVNNYEVSEIINIDVLINTYNRIYNYVINKVW